MKKLIRWFREGRVAGRTRVALIAALAVVATGVTGAVAALLLDPARAAVGPLPAHGLLLPGEARFVMGLDVKRFTASPFYARYAKQRDMQPEALKQLEARTGLDPARDVDQFVVAGSGTGRDAGLALMVGRFDLHKLGRTLEAEGKARGYNHEGVTIYGLREAGAQPMCVAFLSEDALLFGDKARVEAAVSSRTRGETPLRGNATLIGLLSRVRPGSTFWMVGDQSLLAGLPTSMGAAGGASALNLPALRSLMITGDVDPQVSLAITGEAADEPAARNLADVVRGLVAMATLQAQQKPELQQLTSAVTVATEANRVIVSARIPYELLDSLGPLSRPTPAAPAPAPGPVATATPAEPEAPAPEPTASR